MKAISNRHTPRQRIRRGVQYTMLLLFPVTMYYFSPFLSILGATQSIVTGAIFVFAAQFVVALVAGRSFCGWLCPAGALAEVFSAVQPKPLVRGWIRYVKYGIWIVWFSTLVFFLVRGARGPGLTVEPGFHTHGGVSVMDVSGYIVYYGVLSIFVVLALTLGRRGGCHALCWMAPLMALGRWIRNRLDAPALVMRADASACIHCARCTQTCTMSLPVESLVRDGVIDDVDCVLCGECVDVCPKQVIAYGFGRSRRDRVGALRYRRAHGRTRPPAVARART